MSKLEVTEFQKLQILLLIVAIQSKVESYDLLSIEQTLRLTLKAVEMEQPSEDEANASLKSLIDKLYEDVIGEVSS